VHSKKIGTLFTAGLTHFFLVLFINVKGPLYRANRGSLQHLCIYCRAKSVDLPFERIFAGIAQLVSDFRLPIFDLRRGFADPQAHAHDAKDAVAFFQIAGRIEVARESGSIQLHQMPAVSVDIGGDQLFRLCLSLSLACEVKKIQNVAT
jgi:hypothetical protein